MSLMNGDIDCRFERAGQHLILTSRGKDALGLVSGLARIVDEHRCNFITIDFVTHGLGQDEYALIALVDGDKASLDKLAADTKRSKLHALVPQELRNLKRPDTNTGHSGLYLVTCDCHDRIGILECAAAAISQHFGNIVWLRADTLNVDAPQFHITALVAFQKPTTPADVEGGIRRAFKERDARDTKQGKNEVVELRDALVKAIGVR